MSSSASPGPGGIPTQRLLLVSLVALAAVVGSFATALTPVPIASDPLPATKPLGQLIYEEREHFLRHHQGHPEAPPLPPADLIEEVRHVLREEVINGATPVAWMDRADASRLLALRAPASDLPRDLVAETLRVNALVGVALAPEQVAGLRAQADALPAPLRAAFADLVGATADSYEAQLPLAAAVLTRVGPADADRPTMTLQEREASFANAETLLAAMNRFRDALAGIPLSAPVDGFSDPEGLVVLGGTGDDTHAPTNGFKDPVLLVDLGGDDTYLNGAGGACPIEIETLMGFRCNSLVLSAVLDVTGDDNYTYSGPPAVVQGAGAFGAVGLLVDVLGDDNYTASLVRGPISPLFSYIDGVQQGAGQAGVGLLVDGAGRDVYRADVLSTQQHDIWNFAQGYGGLGGLGIAADAGGDDRWLANGLGIKGFRGFQGVYNNGAAFYGGVGVLHDAGLGDDVYHATNVGDTVDYYAQGFGAFGGLGLFVDDGGDDDYSATEEAHNPWVVPLLNCAFGTGSLGGVGIFLELGGNDTYYGASTSTKMAEVMNEGFGGIGAAYGAFVDLSGDDGHFMEVHAPGNSKTAGRGVLLAGGQNKNMVGNYLDLGGVDAYTGAPPSRDNAVWTGGADLNLLVSPKDFLGGP